MAKLKPESYIAIPEKIELSCIGCSFFVDNDFDQCLLSGDDKQLMTDHHGGCITNNYIYTLKER